VSHKYRLANFLYTRWIKVVHVYISYLWLSYLRFNASRLFVHIQYLYYVQEYKNYSHQETYVVVAMGMNTSTKVAAYLFCCKTILLLGQNI
jgi:hypothetical protein